MRGHPAAYDREHCVDLTVLLRDTQPEVAEAVDLAQDGPRDARSWTNETVQARWSSTGATATLAKLLNQLAVANRVDPEQ